MKFYHFLQIMENSSNYLSGFLQDYLENPYKLDTLQIAADYLMEKDNPVGYYLKTALDFIIDKKIYDYYSDIYESRSKAYDYLLKRHLHFAAGASAVGLNQDEMYRFRKGMITTFESQPRIINVKEINNELLISGFFYLIANFLLSHWREEEHFQSEFSNRVIDLQIGHLVSQLRYALNHLLQPQEHYVISSLANSIYDDYHELFNYLTSFQHHYKINDHAKNLLEQIENITTDLHRIIENNDACQIDQGINICDVMMRAINEIRKIVS